MDLGCAGSTCPFRPDHVIFCLLPVSSLHVMPIRSTQVQSAEVTVLTGMELPHSALAAEQRRPGRTVCDQAGRAGDFEQR